MATAAGFLSTLRKKLFREEVAEPEVPLDLQKVETMLDATAARLSALESSLFAFKSDIQYRQQLGMLRGWPGSQLPMRLPAAPGAHPLVWGYAVDPRGEPLPLGCRREAVLWPALRCSPIDADVAVVAMQAAAAAGGGAALHAGGHAL